MAPDTVLDSTSQTKMRIVVLSGASDAGKTTTLNEFAVLLANKTGFRQVDGPNPPQRGHGDQQYLFEKTNSGVVTTIGISTRGDGKDEVDKGFDYFINKRCNIGIIASKTSGQSVKEIEQRCQRLGISPRYLFLICAGDQGTRGRNQVSHDVILDLFAQL